MSALIQSRMAKPMTAKYKLRPLAAGAKVFKNGLAMSVTTGPNAGCVEAANTTDDGVIVGTFAEDADNSAGAAGALSVNVEFPVERQMLGFDNDTTTPVTAAMLELPCFALDDHTVTAAQNSKPAGIVFDVSANGQVVYVEALQVPAEAPATGHTLHVARAVVTSIAAYAAASGTLTASANGALGAQDGVTLSVGDIVLLPTDKASAAADAGPYEVMALGGASAKFKLSRPIFYPQGSTQGTGQMITVDGEGTKYGGSEWKAIGANSTFVVGTTDGGFYPRLQSVTTVAMTAGVSAANSTLYVSPIAQVTAIPVTPGGTQGILRISTQTAGLPTASSLVATSSSNTDTSTVKLLVVNF